MSTRLPALFAIFVTSTLLTRAGFAGASEVEAAEPEPLPSTDVAGPRVEVERWSSAIDLRELEAAPLDEAQVWQQRIAGRLAALEHEREHAGADVHEHAELAARMRALLAKLPADAQVAIEVRDLERNTVLVDIGKDRALAPASTHKLITAIAAVELLGPDYRFETEVLREGDTLYLRGEGDPDLQVEDLHALIDQLARAGEIDGVRRVVVDDSTFSPTRFGPGFDDQGPGDSFRAPSGALALHWSTVVVTVRPGKQGEAPQVDISPASPFVAIDNTARTAGAADQLAIESTIGPQGETTITVRGSIPAGHGPSTLRRRVGDPGLVAGGAFARLLGERLGVHHGDSGVVLAIERGTTPASARLVATHESEPLLAVLGSALRWSNNFTAEQVLRTLAWRATGEPGDWQAGIALLERFAAAVSPTHADKAHFVNGSGLTRDGRATPGLLVDVLALGEREGSPAALLRASMPSAGEGTLHNRLPGAGDHLQAKTGTYAGASALAGLVHAQNGRRRLGFAILVNGGDSEDNRALQDDLVAVLLRGG